MTRILAALAALGLLAGACTGAPAPSRSGKGLSATSGSPRAAPEPSGTPSGQASADGSTLASLCTGPSPTESPSAPISPRRLPAAVAAVAGQVERVRGLRFESPVVPEPVTAARIARLSTAGLDDEFPPAVWAKRARAWGTIGVVPVGADLHRAFLDLESSQVIGFYDEVSKRLVFVGSRSPTPFERITLAHELTHAVDDQHFDLGRLDRLSSRCRDDRTQAFLSLAEGDAVMTSVQWARSALSGQEIQQVLQEASAAPAPPASVPPFLVQLFEFPYPNGQSFVSALQARGGEAAVDAAFRSPPVSTEQILHPSAYPSDVPQDVEVPNLRAKLGAGWRELDVQDVGEAWLLLLLELRLSEGGAQAAAAGWDGGQYRAWSKGSETAVLLETTWDTDGDAREFRAAMRSWLGDRPSEVQEEGRLVSLLFASDQPTLTVLRQAAARA